jgi:PIN domain nuclease of toxin-antitoxin system
VIAGVADTHTALWHLFDDARLSSPARDFIDKAAAGTHRIAVSSISLAEVVYLIEKSRLPPSAYDDLKLVLADPDHVLEEAPFTVGIVDALRLVPRVAVPDMPDRIVAATAVFFGVPVISRDGRASALPTSKPSGEDIRLLVVALRPRADFNSQVEYMRATGSRPPAGHHPAQKSS